MGHSRERESRKRSDSRSKKDKKDKKDRKDKKEKKEKKENRDSRERKHREKSKDRKDRKPSRERDDKRDRKDKKDKKKREKSEDRKLRRSKDRSRSRQRRSPSKSYPRDRRKRSPKRTEDFEFDSPPKDIVPKKEPFNPAAQAEQQQQQGGTDISNILNNPDINPKMKQFLIQVSQNKVQTELQTSKCDRKLYIGNIPPGSVPAKIQIMINGALKQLKVNQEQGESCVSIWISPEGNYGFAEFRTPEETTKALNVLPNVTLQGHLLKVGRPAQYTSTVQVEQQNGSTTSGFNSSGQFSILSLLNPDGNQNGQADAPLSQIPQLAVPGIESLSLPKTNNFSKITVQIPTRILILNNMIGEGELIIDEEFKQIEEDVKEECSKHGKVVKITIPRPDDKNEAIKGSGHVFVEYETIDAARDARRDLNGRLFNNRTVQAQYFNEQKYIQSELDYKVK